MPSLARSIVLLVVALLCSLVLPWRPAPLQAQTAPAPTQGAGEVVIQSITAGLGGRPRPGSWTPFLFSVTDRGTEIRNVLIRLETTDLDGDTSQWSRPITTTPGKAVQIWIYARLPFRGDTFTAAAYQAVERASTDAEGGAKVSYAAGRRLGSTTVRLNAPVTSTEGLYLIVGSNRCGLDGYAQRMNSQAFSPTGHELTEIVAGVKPTDLPDRALGLRACSAIFWFGSALDEQPSRLTVPQADAIRDWVAAGGHLVIVLPTVGQSWLETPGNPLADIMPAASPVRRDGVNLDGYRPLLTRATTLAEQERGRTIPLPSSVTLHSLEASAAAGPYEAMPILDGPADAAGNRDVIVMRRLYGCGAVTVIGLDLTHPGLVGEALRPDFFWHRILGRRGDLTPIKDLIDRPNTNLQSSRREPVNVDGVINANIQREAKSAGGLLLALVVFSAFWLAAGPVSFYVLRGRKLAHYSWLAFAGCIAVFTALSWTGASMLRQRKPDARFIGILDHVYGQPTERARIWANVFLPSYGEESIGVQGPTGAGVRLRPSLTPWDPSDSQRAWTGFPDIRGYSIDARTPESISFPSRSTEKSVLIDWAGPPHWSMPFPGSPSGSPVHLGDEISLTRLDPPRNGRSWALSGTLKHDLPSSLEGVIIIVVRNQTLLRMRGPGPAIPAETSVFRLPGAWEAGDVLDLAGLGTALVAGGAGAGERVGAADELLGDLVPRLSTANAFRSDYQSNAAQYLAAVSFFDLLEPPDLTSQRDSTLVQREDTHGYDLSRWFTQPCVIVMGVMRDAESPVPIFVDGKETPAKGMTMVRWVYPLPPAPPSFDVTDPTAPSGG